MNKVLIASLLSVAAFAAEYGFLDYYFVDPDRPVHFAGRYRQIGEAKFKSRKYGHLDYADGYAALFYTHFLDPDNSLSWGLGYDYLKVGWGKNPRFDQSHFNYATASLGYVSTAVERWRWIVNGGFTVDAQNFNFGQTAVYHGMLWGRYHFSDCCGVHAGVMGWYGVKNGYALPIFGFDWKWGSNWSFNAIFPIDFSVNYSFDDNWSTEVAYSGFGGPYRYPRRSEHGKNSYQDPIFELYAKGVDWNILYKYDHLLRAVLGVGWNAGGWLYIKNQNNEHGKYFHYNSAFYAQGTLAFTF